MRLGENSMLNKTVSFYNGVQIPIIGLGTWQTPNDIAARVVKEGIEVGYIHIDTAAAYRNEKGVGEGIKLSGVDRKKLFITTKIPAELKSYKEAKESIQRSLELLDLDYIDLIIIHCPTPWNEYARRTKDYFKENVEVYRALEEAYEEGKLRAIGVSNFSIADIQNIMDHCKIKPMINQIPWFIGCRDEKLKEFCNKNQILVESYSPLGTGRIIDKPEIVKMAEKYNVTPAQLCIRFALQDVDITLPKTTHKERMIENAKVDFEISKDDFELLKSLKF
jgi:diketogulonate reductase-like aldo/keto reductase